MAEGNRADGNQGPELDPKVWKELSDDLLEKVIAKLPFSRVIAFQVVCKRWYSNVIPTAAAQLEGAGPSAFLYFSCQFDVMKELHQDSGYHKREYSSHSWWLQVRNFKTQFFTGTYDYFNPKSFPAPSNGEDVNTLGVIFTTRSCCFVCATMEGLPHIDLENWHFFLILLPNVLEMQ